MCRERERTHSIVNTYVVCVSCTSALLREAHEPALHVTCAAREREGGREGGGGGERERESERERARERERDVTQTGSQRHDFSDKGGLAGRDNGLVD